MFLTGLTNKKIYQLIYGHQFKFLDNFEVSERLIMELTSLQESFKIILK